MPQEEEKFNYQVAYKEKLKEAAELKERNEEILKNIQSLQERLVQSREEYYTQFEKYFKVCKENEKLKIIIAKLLEEKFTGREIL